MNKGQRCVVLADGFYEWTTDEHGKKQPYFVYFEEPKPGEEPKLMAMAGLYDSWKPKHGRTYISIS